MDDSDKATETEELERERALAAARRPVAGLAATGRCLWCSEALAAQGARFCDPDCRDSFDAWRRRGKAGLA